MQTPPQAGTADGRALYSARDLEPLIAPRSIAVVGASNKPGYGLQVLRAIRGGGYRGSLFAVHPREHDVDGVPATAKVRDLPESPDLVIVGVQAAAVVDVLADCAEQGARSVLIHAAGFAETATPEGLRRQREIDAIRTASGMKIVGPNCLGLWNFRQNLSLARRLRTVRNAGPVGIVSQSGGLGSFLFDIPGEVNPFSYCLCSGNSIDVDVFDLMNYLVEDEQTRAIALIAEGISDGYRLQEVGARARKAGKPIVAFKCGRTERGATAALSHTASIAGDRPTVDAAFAHAGIVTVDGYDDLVETALFFAKARPRPHRAGGVGVATTTGGFAVMACDAAEESEVSLPEPSATTATALREVIPGFGTVGNPADLAGGPGGAQRFSAALRAFATDSGFDHILVPLGASMDGVIDRVRDASDLAADAPSDVSVYWVSPWESGPAFEAIVADSRLTVFRSLRRYFQAVRNWQWWNATEVPFPAVTDRSRPEVTAALDEFRSSTTGSSVALDEVAARSLCAAAGIELVEGELVHDEESAAAAARHIGANTVVKVVSAALAHKSDVGGVRVGLTDPEQTATAFREVLDNVRRHAPEAQIRGALVTRMVTGIAELLVGARRDPVFGPVLVLNWGGTTVELGAAPVVRLAPVDKAQALTMIDSLAGAARLRGYRGAPAADVDALAETLVRLSDLMISDVRVAEAELNPVLLGADGQGATALDCLVVLDDPDTRREPEGSP